MKVMVLVKATPSSERGDLPSEELFREMDNFNAALVQAGIMKHGEGLKPSSQGARVLFNGKNRTVTDGPFAETKELVAGFWLWEVSSMDEAIEWVKRCPNPMPEESEIEIRPLFEMSDFAEVDPTGELAELEDQLRAQVETMSADEAEIRRLVSQWSHALERKDVDAMLSNYADDAVLFDAIPPYKTVGKEKIREVWSQCLPYFPDSFKSEHRDMTVHTMGDTAIMHALHHFVPDDPNHPAGQTWMRVTVGYQRVNGKWMVVHEHVSIPFNPMSNEAWLIRDPDKLDAPNYGASE